MQITSTFAVQRHREFAQCLNLGSSHLVNNGNIDLKTIIGDNLAVSTCQYKYSFELTPIGGNESSGEQVGNPNLNGRIHYAIIQSIFRLRLIEAS